MRLMIKTSGLALSAAVLAGCVAQTKIVSTETLPLYQSADATSPMVGLLKYGDAVTLKSTWRVAPPFTGNRSLFPEDLIPGWSLVDCGSRSGYLPDNALVSEYLAGKQDPDKVIDATGAMAPINGFTNNSAKPRVRAIAGFTSSDGAPASKEVEVEVDVAKTRKVLEDCAADKSFDLAGFLAAGGLAVKAVPAETTGDGKTSLMTSMRQTAASGISVAGSAFEDSPVAGASGVAAEFVYSEIGPVQEFQTGFFVAGGVLNSYSPVPRTEARSRYVASLGQTLAAASNAPMPYRGHHFVLMEGAEPNAFAVAGGFIFVTTGMLDFLHDEDELAAILAHEMGHLELQHGMKAVGQEKVLGLLNVIEQCDKAITTQDPLLNQLKEEAKAKANELLVSLTEGVRNGYSRELESQADWRSLQLCDRLGYDTTALYDVLERFKKEHGSYGGAAYPQERGADVLLYRQQLGHGPADAAARQRRAARYRQAVGK